MNDNCTVFDDTRTTSLTVEQEKEVPIMWPKSANRTESAPNNSAKARDSFVQKSTNKQDILL